MKKFTTNNSYRANPDDLNTFYYKLDKSDLNNFFNETQYDFNNYFDPFKYYPTKDVTISDRTELDKSLFYELYEKIRENKRKSIEECIFLYGRKKYNTLSMDNSNEAMLIGYLIGIAAAYSVEIVSTYTVNEIVDICETIKRRNDKINDILS